MEYIAPDERCTLIAAFLISHHVDIFCGYSLEASPRFIQASLCKIQGLFKDF